MSTAFTEQTKLVEQVLHGASEAIVIWMPRVDPAEGEPNVKACVKLHNGPNSLLSPMLDTILSGLKRHEANSRTPLCQSSSD